MSCAHENFRAQVDVARLEDSGRFSAEIRIECVDCGVPFQFLGLPIGIDLNGATISADGLEARIAIAAAGSVPHPLEAIAKTPRH